MGEQTILVVEDEPVIATELQYILKKQGYHVPEPAFSGKEAIRLAQSIKPDLILMDIVLHGPYDGIETTKRIQHRIQIPIVYITAYSDRTTFNRAQKTNNYGYLIKPVEKAMLLSAIDTAISRHKLEQQLRERLKELEGLYLLNELSCQNLSIDQILRRFVDEIAPSSTQFPHEAYCEVILDTQTFESREKRPKGSRHYLAAPIIVEGKKRGEIHLGYTKEDLAFIPRYEQKLVNAFASKISELVHRDNMQKQLEYSEAKYKQLFHTMNRGIVYHDRDGRIISANPAAERILGLSLDQMQGRTSTDPRWRSVHKDGSPFPGDTHPAMQSLRTGKKVQGVVMGVYNPDKSEYRWILVNAVPLFHPEESEPFQAYATFDDITEKIKTEKELRKSEENLAITFQSIGDAVISTDVQGYIRRMNPVAEELTGWSQEEALGRTAEEVVKLIDSTTKEKITNPIYKVLKQGVDINIPHHSLLLSRDGKQRQIADSAALIRDEEGKLFGVILVLRDVTEDYSRRQEIEESRKMLRLVLDNIPQRVYWKDRKLRYLGGNTVFAADTLFDNPSKLIGKSDSELPWPEEEIERYRQEDLDILNSKQALYYLERHRTQAGGKKIWVEETKVPIQDANGEVIGILGSYEDITARKKAEEFILKAKTEWERTFDSVPDLIALIDTNFKIKRVNKALANRLGMRPVDCVGKACYKLIHGKTEPPVNCPHSKSLERKEEAKIEFSEEQLGGHFIFTASPIYDEEGKLQGTVEVARDITDLTNARNRLLESIRDKEILLQEIHHRVKNNLQIILSMLNLQLRNIGGKNIHEVIIESQNRIRSMSLVHDKLYRSGDFTNLDLGEYLSSLINEIFVSYYGSNLKIKHREDFEKIPIDLDTAIPCGLIVNELVSNAIKHAFDKEEEGEIRLAVYGSKNDFSIAVSDNGKGLPPDFDIRKADTMGFQLINALVLQIDAELSLEQDGQTRFLIHYRGQR